MKTVHATAGTRENPVNSTVQLNRVSDRDELTPALARTAARIAFGHTSGVTVSDGRTAYRLTGSGARKITVEPDLSDFVL